MKVLLVEDHPSLARISCDLLRDVHGHDVVHAATGAEAEALAESFGPEIVVIDLNLPDMTGYELAQRLRGRPQFADTVLVALTGFGNVVNAEHAQRAGFDAQYRKPMDFEELPRLKRKGA